MKKCKVCKAEFKQVYSTTQSTCSVTCAVELANQKKQKDWEKRKRNVKEELRTIQDYIKIAQQVVNKYIRLRDKDSSCFTCDSKLGAKYDAGHFFSAGGHWSVRFDERNIHAQCVNCNQHKHGNLIEYQKRLVSKLGYDEYALLEAESKKTRNYTKEELKEIIDTYKNKIKELTLNQ
jgi:Bacteriophage Lambda NinG protein